MGEFVERKEVRTLLVIPVENYCCFHVLKIIFVLNYCWKILLLDTREVLKWDSPMHKLKVFECESPLRAQAGGV